QFCDRCVDEVGVQMLDGSERPCNIVLVRLQRVNDRLSAMGCCSCDIKDVARSDTRTSVVDFLRDDFGNSFEGDLFTLDHLIDCRCFGQGESDDEVDLSDVIECELEEARTIPNVVGWPDLE